MKKKKLCIVTSTRAEYGLLRNIIKKAQQDDSFETALAVTGSHLSLQYGNTVEEIEKDSVKIDERIEILNGGDSELDICINMGKALTAFADYFERTKPDMVMLLGDRYEICAIACAAVNMRVPIVHLYGGETTEGAVDEAFRHSITKMSYLHFTATEVYRNRVIQLGEDPERVYNVGSMGIENIKTIPLMSREELSGSIGIDLSGEYVIGTFHPVTLEAGSAEVQCKELMEACGRFPDLTFVFTKANADVDGNKINKLLEEYAHDKENIYLVDSLGYRRYLSALNNAEFVIGNSSSGITEAPSFKIPTINIGIRQKGRIQADSIINCMPVSDDIDRAIREALFMDCSNVSNPYEKEGTSDFILRVIKEYLENNKIYLAKRFFDK